tara:strand:+ start:534 stop:980 length:447 start_codon:yes stop_codon:yes gene_type:complete
MKLYIASDHGGFKVKEKLQVYLEKKGHTVEDVGPSSLDMKDDYPDYAIPLGEKVVRSRAMGIIACRNGQGIAIAANKVKGVRAVTGFSVKEVKTTRKDDNANVLSIPSDYMSWPVIVKMVNAFISTPFSGKLRHKRRLRKVARYERGR